ncbi:hypothetical protein Tco_0666126 [Tanacetum coccineum]
MSTIPLQAEKTVYTLLTSEEIVSRLEAIGPRSELVGYRSEAIGPRLELVGSRSEALGPRNSGGYSGPNSSFDKSASPERLFSSARVSLAEASLSQIYPLDVPRETIPHHAPQSSICQASLSVLDLNVPFSFLPTFSIMAKKDIDLYHSRLTPDDLNDLIIKYKIPRDLHPRLPSEYFVMSELPNNAIGIYHQMFDFSGVRIPFSSFLLALVKHYRVYFSQLGPLGLNKVITFEVMCRSLQIEPTVTLFRVLQTLCKQGDWFSFAKCRAPSPVCIDDNHSCMKHWKSGFFLIDWRAILDAMVWRHPNAAIDDPRPAAGSFNLADVYVCDLVLRGADRNVMGIHDFLILPEWTGAEVQEEPHSVVRPTLQSLPFYCTPPDAPEAVIPNPTLKDLAVGTPSFKIVAKAEASQNLFLSDDDESDDYDACVEIPLVTPLRSAAVIPSSGNQSESPIAPTVEGFNTRGNCS